MIEETKVKPDKVIVLEDMINGYRFEEIFGLGFDNLIIPKLSYYPDYSFEKYIPHP